MYFNDESSKSFSWNYASTLWSSFSWCLPRVGVCIDIHRDQLTVIEIYIVKSSPVRSEITEKSEMYRSKKGRLGIFILIFGDSYFFICLCCLCISFQWTDFEKYLLKRNLSDEFEKELNERKNEEKKMRKCDMKKEKSIEWEKSLRNQNQPNKNSSKRYVYVYLYIDDDIIK